MQWKGERLALKTLGPQRKSCNALGTTRSTLFAEMFPGEKFVCIITAKSDSAAGYGASISRLRNSIGEL